MPATKLPTADAQSFWQKLKTTLKGVAARYRGIQTAVKELPRTLPDGVPHTPSSQQTWTDTMQKVALEATTQLQHLDTTMTSLDQKQKLFKETLAVCNRLETELADRALLINEQYHRTLDKLDGYIFELSKDLRLFDATLHDRFGKVRDDPDVYGLYILHVAAVILSTMLVGLQTVGQDTVVVRDNLRNMTLLQDLTGKVLAATEPAPDTEANMTKVATTVDEVVKNIPLSALVKNIPLSALRKKLLIFLIYLQTRRAATQEWAAQSKEVADAYMKNLPLKERLKALRTEIEALTRVFDATATLVADVVEAAKDEASTIAQVNATAPAPAQAAVAEAVADGCRKLKQKLKGAKKQHAEAVSEAQQSRGVPQRQRTAAAREPSPKAAAAPKAKARAATPAAAAAAAKPQYYDHGPGLYQPAPRRRRPPTLLGLLLRALFLRRRASR